MARTPRELGLYDGMAVLKNTDGHAVGKKGRKDYTPEKYDKKADLFGTVVLVSNMDEDLDTIYAIYRLRWEIEVVFKEFKDFIDAGTTREYNDWSVVGSGFVKLLSCTMTCRMKGEIARKGLFKTMTYYEIMDRFSDVFRTGSGKEWTMTTLSLDDARLLETLTLGEGSKQSEGGQEKADV